MTPEQIVRALAAADPYHHDHEGDIRCGLCEPWHGLTFKDATNHEPDCPWRLAVEWTAARDALRDREQVLYGPRGWPQPKWGGITVTADPSQPRGTFKAMYPLPEGAMFLPGGSTADYVVVDGERTEIKAPVAGPGWFVYNAEKGTLDHVSPQYFEGQWHPRP